MSALPGCAQQVWARKSVQRHTEELLLKSVPAAEPALPEGPTQHPPSWTLAMRVLVKPSPVLWEHEGRPCLTQRLMHAAESTLVACRLRPVHKQPLWQRQNYGILCPALP